MICYASDLGGRLLRSCVVFLLLSHKREGCGDPNCTSFSHLTRSGLRGEGRTGITLGAGGDWRHQHGMAGPGRGMESDRSKGQWQRGWRDKGLTEELCTLQTHFSVSGKITSMEFCQFRPI